MSTPEHEPTEEELRAAYEAELSRITSVEMVIQSAVSLLNVGGRRLGLAPGSVESQRDLEQVRDAIDAVRGLLPVLERRLPPQELGPLRDALSQLQMAYARETQAAGQASGAPSAGGPQADSTSEAGGARQGPGAGSQPPTPPADKPPSEGSPGPGPAESSGRLWVPGR